MLRYSFKQEDAAQAIERAVAETLAAGYFTGDLYSDHAEHPVQSTSQMGEQIVSRIRRAN
jgi:3-isopropylmalate dehydrogenase